MTTDLPETVEATYRRRRVVTLVVILALFVVVVNVAQWMRHDRSQARLDEEQGERLKGLAQVAATLVDGEMIQRWLAWGIDPDEHDRLRTALRRVAGTSSVASVYLVDRDGGSILDLSGVLAFAEYNPILELDRAPFALAASGIAGVSASRRVEGAYLKAAYVPVEADDGDVIGVLIVEAASGLFTVLGDIRNTAIVVGIGSVITMVALGWFLLRVSDSLSRAEHQLVRGETLATMGRMAASIAHEVRNPLGIIRATAERLGRHATDEQKILSDSILEEVDRLNGIVSGYLNFAQDRSSEPSSVDLADVVRKTLMVADSELTGVDLHQSIEVSPALVRGDAARLRQVLLNLVLNARQAMRDGGRLDVELARIDGAARFRVVVRDTGVGIPRAQLEQVWKPFVTSKNDGSGLGLAVVRRIIDQHHGRVRIESEEGVGTTVTMELPAAAAAAAG